MQKAENENALEELKKTMVLLLWMEQRGGLDCSMQLFPIYYLYAERGAKESIDNIKR